jgi:sulfopyruvate decarboxylase subunit beta
MNKHSETKSAAPYDMRRWEAIQEISGVLEDEFVVCNLGHASQELYAAGDRDRNFYMLGSMGLASSIGLGVALSTDETVISIDGDGAVLMNLGTLASIGHDRPDNYVLIIIDNHAHGATGFQPTFTAGGVDLAAVGEACGIPTVRRVTKRADVAPVLRAVLARREKGPALLVIHTEVGRPTEGIGVIPMTSTEIRDRFMKALRS